MKPLSLTLFISFLSVFGFSQNYSETIVEGADRYTKSKKIGRYDLSVEMMHPVIVEKGGGKESMLEIIKNEQDMLLDQGFEVLETTTLLPLEPVSTNSNLHCLVPQLIVLKVGEAKFRSKRWILASSPDNGENWYYLNLDAYTNKSIKIFFPDWNEELVIPAPEPATMIEE